MSDNAAFVLFAVLGTCVLFGLGTCGYKTEMQKGATEDVRQRALAASRDRCIQAGNGWIDNNCIPRCLK